MSPEIRTQRAALGRHATRCRAYLRAAQQRVIELLQNRGAEHWRADDWNRKAGRPPDTSWGWCWLGAEKLVAAKAALLQAQVNYTAATTTLQLFDELHQYPHKPYVPLIEPLDCAAIESAAYDAAGPEWNRQLAALDHLVRHTAPTPFPTPEPNFPR